MPYTDKKKANEYRTTWGRKQLICECGQLITNGGRYSHKKSKKHTDAMAIIEAVDVPPRIEAKLKKWFPLLTQSKLKRIVAIILE